MMSIVSARYDIARFGAEVFRSSPRQADLLIVSGRVAHKMAAPLRQIYDQMLEPKWVIAMGACASSGGMFNNYTVLQGVDKIVAVDIHVPGCPPRPEALMEGIIRLQEEIKAGVPPAYEIRGRRDLTYEGVPGLVETREAHGETTLVVDPARLVEACTHLRDEEGFNILSDITPTDYLGWGARGVAGYIGTAVGPRPEPPGSQGLRAHARAEAEALRDELPPARGPGRAARARPGLARRGRAGRRASSRSGRPPTGTSARPGT